MNHVWYFHTSSEQSNMFANWQAENIAQAFY